MYNKYNNNSVFLFTDNRLSRFLNFTKNCMLTVKCTFLIRYLPLIKHKLEIMFSYRNKNIVPLNKRT